MKDVLGSVLNSARTLLVGCAFAFALAIPGIADTFTYTYQGNSFTNFSGGYNCSPGPCAIQGSFTVADQLDAGLSGATVTPESWTFNDGNGFTLDSTSLFEGISVTGIGTDAIGNITAWDVTAIGCLAHCYIATSMDGTTKDQSVLVDVLPVFDEAYNTGMPGTWTCTENPAISSSSTGAIPCPAAPLAPTPEPSMTWPLGAFVAVAAVVLRRRHLRSDRTTLSYGSTKPKALTL